MFTKINLDALGVSASILCAIHCAILPLVVASLPIFGVNIVHNALFEYGMIALIANQVWHNWELAFLPVAVLLVVSAHVLNYRWCRTRRFSRSGKQ
jgi:hypothetical protein